MPGQKPGRSKTFEVGAKVMTPLGVGNVRFVYPVGPHHKITYAVAVEGYRVNRIFDEKQVQPLSQLEAAGPTRREPILRSRGVRL